MIKAIEEYNISTQRGIQGLFPTPVQVSTLPFELSAEEKKEILDYETKFNEGNLVTKESYILKKNKKLKRLNKWFLNEIKIYQDQILCPAFDFSLYITQSWINRSKKGQWHHRHRHPNSIVSGVFYIQTDDSDKILFGKNINYEQINIPVHENKFNPFNSYTWWLQAKENNLLLFPSGLEHQVPPVESNKERVSMSFNTWFKGYMGDDESLTGLHL